LISTKECFTFHVALRIKVPLGTLTQTETSSRTLDNIVSMSLGSNRGVASPNRFAALDERSPEHTVPSTPVDEEELVQELSSHLRTLLDPPQQSGTQHSLDSDDDDKQGDRALDLIPDTVTKEQYEALEQIF
jgi:hypothetical protein